MALTHVCLDLLTKQDLRDEIVATVNDRMRDMGPMADTLKAKVVLTEVGEEAAIRAAANKKATHLKFTALKGLLDRLDEAQTAIEQAVTLAPMEGAIGLEAGVIAILLGRENAARQSWQSVIEIQPASLAAQTAKEYLAQIGPADIPQENAPKDIAGQEANP